MATRTKTIGTATHSAQSGTMDSASVGTTSLTGTSTSFNTEFTTSDRLVIDHPVLGFYSYDISAIGGAGSITIVGGLVEALGGTETPYLQGTARDYTTITEWEADLDDGTNAAVDATAYGSTDTADGDIYADSIFDELVTINGGGTVGLSALYLGAASGQEPAGIQGGGPCLMLSASAGASPMIFVTITTTGLRANVHIHDIECDGNGKSVAYMFRNNTTSNDATNFYRCFGHDGGNGAPGGLNSVFSKSSSGLNLFRCSGWDVNSNGTSQDAVIFDLTSGSSRPGDAVNCSGIRASSGSSSGDAVIFAVPDHASRSVYNCVGALTEITGGGTGTPHAFGDVGGTYMSSMTTVDGDYNADDDSSALGANSINVQATITNEFLNTTLGTVDLHLVSSANCIDAGYDAGTFVSGLYGTNADVDVDMIDYSALAAASWDIGWHEYVAAGGGGSNFGSRPLLLVGVGA